MPASDKTEEATPKRQDETREKGQVARSIDLTGAVVLLAGLFALSAIGPRMFAEMQAAMHDGLLLTARPEMVNNAADLNGLARESAWVMVRVLGPLSATVAIAAVVINLLQVRWRLTPKALIPDFRKLDPLQGAKNVFGPNALVESVKAMAKIGVVAAVVLYTVMPLVQDVATLTGISPAEMGSMLGSTIMTVAQRAAFVYLIIGAADFGWQRHRHAKSIRMSTQEVRMEHRQQELPPEVRGAIRRRQSENSRARMMADVPTADVVIMNPTHFAVALRYDPAEAAPTVVAKGQDLVALRIRDIGRENGVEVVENPPLARQLYKQVEVGHPIPEELFQAVAEILAFVFRINGRQAAVGA